MQRIVVGVDGSDGARRALEWAVAEGSIRKARLEAVHVWHYPYLAAGPLTPEPIPSTDAIASAARAELDRAVAAVDAGELAAPIERIVMCGGAAASLLEVAKGADLLVVGSRGRGAFAGLLLGSVSQEVAHHAPCAVVIVPEER